jgi:hypothetical protein
LGGFTPLLRKGIAFSRLHAILLVLAVLGLGAIIEMVEYGVVLTVGTNGVGAYATWATSVPFSCKNSGARSAPLGHSMV